MDLLKEFQQYIKQQHLFQPKDKLLLAVSGGADSVVLCELCKQSGYDFTIAHCNFQLRGAESERDEHFVTALGQQYGVEVLVKKFDTEKYAQENKLSIQVAARALRYAWFNDILDIMKSSSNKEGAHCQPPTANFVLTAHHANDNMETLLMNFFKGTGISGLHGILPKKGNVIRPLLFAKKEAVIAFAAANDLHFVDDSSNASDKYTRNYFRNQLIPDLQQVFPQVEDNLLNNIDRFREIELLYHQSVNLHKKKLLQPKGNEIHIPVLKLLKTIPLHTMVYEIIRDHGFTAHQTDEVVALLKSETGKYIQSATHRILKNRNWIIIAPIQNADAEIICIEAADSKIAFQQGKISMELLTAKNFKPQTTNLVAQLNASGIKFPLLLRKWKPGDYFYPLGMQNLPAGRGGKKKLSRFFIDQKRSLIQKERTWVIEMDKKIIWVVGMRIDDRFKITGSTENILQITLIPSE